MVYQFNPLLLALQVANHIYRMTDRANETNQQAPPSFESSRQKGTNFNRLKEKVSSEPSTLVPTRRRRSNQTLRSAAFSELTSEFPRKFPIFFFHQRFSIHTITFKYLTLFREVCSWLICQNLCNNGDWRKFSNQGRRFRGCVLRYVPNVISRLQGFSSRQFQQI